MIDALSAQVGAGLTYIQNGIAALVQQGAQHEFLVLLSMRYQRGLTGLLPPGPQIADADIPPNPMAWRLWYLWNRLPQVLKKHKIDVLFAIAESSYPRLSIPLVILAGNLSIYKGDFTAKAIIYRLTRKPLVFFSMRNAVHVAFVSNTLRNIVLNTFPLPVSKTSVVHHGLNHAFGEPHHPWLLAEEHPYILYVSSLTPHKNHETLLRALATLPPRGPRLVIAGKPVDTATVKRIRALTEELRLEHRVRFLGEVPHERLPGLYQGSLIVAFPSRLESFGHPLLEAMASGVPIVASSLPACRELCQDAALYFDAEDAGQLSDHLLDLLHRPELRTMLGELGRRRAREFSWDSTARKTLRVLEDAAGR